MHIKRTIIYSILAISLILLLLQTSCLKSKRPGIPLKVVEVLNISGKNKPNLNKYILYSLESSDSLQKKASYFILENMHKNYTSFYHLADSNGHNYIFEPKKYSNLNAILSHIDSLEQANGALFYQADSFSIDHKNIDFNLLYNNQLLAFEAIDENTLKNQSNLNLFLNYTLPYRVSNEIIEPFRKKLKELLENKIKESNTIDEKVYAINDAINQLVKYDARYIKSLERKKLDDILNEGVSNLENINIIKVKALRSFGIPATIDYCPVLTDTNGSYLWTAVFKPDGSKILLDIENGVLSNILKHKITKVYRRTYSFDTSSLFLIKDVRENTPPYLGHYNYLDVSSEYGQKLNYSTKTQSNNKYAYLAVYNDNKWRPIDWALNIKGSVNFENLGENIIYLPVFWNYSKIEAFYYPFCFYGGKKHVFEASNSIREISVKQNSPTSKLSAGMEYKTYYWNYKWIETEHSFKNSKLKFKAPANTIYLIKDKVVGHQYRIFTVEGGNQKFY